MKEEHWLVILGIVLVILVLNLPLFLAVYQGRNERYNKLPQQSQTPSEEMPWTEQVMANASASRHIQNIPDPQYQEDSVFYEKELPRWEEIQQEHRRLEEQIELLQASLKDTQGVQGPQDTESDQPSDQA